MFCAAVETEMHLCRNELKKGFDFFELFLVFSNLICTNILPFTANDDDKLTTFTLEVEDEF